MYIHLNTNADQVNFSQLNELKDIEIFITFPKCFDSKTIAEQNSILVVECHCLLQSINTCKEMQLTNIVHYVLFCLPFVNFITATISIRFE